MKGKWKRLLAFLCIAVMCVTFTPITASAGNNEDIIIGKDTGNTLFGARKTLDLQGAGASVQFTDADRKANTAEAAQEYDDIISETLALFEPVYYDMAEYIQTTYNIDLTDGNGNIAEDWPTKVTAVGDMTVDDILRRSWFNISEGENSLKLDLIVRAYFDDFSYPTVGYAAGIPGSRMEKYLRYRYFRCLYPAEKSDPLFGSVEWYQRYVKIASLKGNSSSAERSNFIRKRAVQLNSDTINERLQSVLSDAKIDFYLESFDSSEETANGIGDEIKLDNQNFTVYNGEYSDSSADSVHLTSVDFSNKDQFYDSEIWDALPDFGDTLSSNIMEDGFIDNLSLLDHFFLFDGGSLESAANPYVHKAGGLTYTYKTVWPYESASKPYEGGEWNSESLANYSILGDDLFDSTSNLFSFSSEMELVGTNSISSTGYDIYIPEFDGNGNIVSVSKPMFNELRDPEDDEKDLDQFDRDKLTAALDLDRDNDGTNDAGVYRYKMVEDTNNAKVNGQPVVASSDYQIFDVVVDENGNIHFFVYDDIDGMTDAYSQENVTYESELGAIGYGFTINNYMADGSVTLKAEKTVDGEIPDSGQTFKFELIDEDGNVVSTAANERGSVTFDPVTFDGNDMGKTFEYTIVEVRDSGSGGSYTYDSSYYTAEVTVGDSVDKTGNILDISVVYKDSDGNVIDGVPVFKNEATTETTPATGSISIHKTLGTYDADKSMFNQQDLSLYGFTLYAKNDIVSPADGTTVLYKAGTAVSAEVSCDKSGNAEISGILPGEYVLKETKMPAGTTAVTSEPEIKVAADDSGSIDIYVNGEKQSPTSVINFENAVSKTEIQKRDESGEYLEGATLQLIDSDTGEVQDTWVTGTDAYKIAGLEFGNEYTLRETDVPDGYQKADDITFVPEGSGVKTVTMTSSKTPVMTDEDTSNDENSSNSGDTENTDNTGNGNTANSTTSTSTDTSTDTGSGSGTTVVNTTGDGGSSNGSSTVSSNGGSTVSSSGVSTGTSGSSANVKSVKTGDDSILPETAAVTVAALAALGIILAARKRKNE
ncbi:MAG: SpaA isopeptide-forming pilin-related protein [Anaerovoracaceae bacterium]